MLNIQSAYKAFNQNIILDHINLNMTEQSIIGLAGASGCGKSTLLRCIQKLDVLDSGTIEVTGETGFMFQDFQLFPHFNVLKNISYALEFTQNKLDSEKMAYDLLNQLGLHDNYLADRNSGLH